MPEPEVVFVVDQKRVDRRRASRKTHLVIDGGIVIVGVVLAALGALSPQTIGVENPGLLSLGILALLGIGSYALWSDYGTLLRINFSAVSALGIWPPFKPKQRLSKGDWFVPYKDIVSIAPVAEKGGFIPAYDVTLRDGLTFQLNALELLVYVNEKEVRRYAKMLSIIKAEIEKPENRVRAEKGEDIVMTKERFEAITRDAE